MEERDNTRWYLGSGVILASIIIMAVVFGSITCNNNYNETLRQCLATGQQMLFCKANTTSSSY